MSLTFLPIPTNLQPLQLREVARVREMLLETDEAPDGVLRWVTNGNVVGPVTLRDGFVACPPRQQAAYEQYVYEACRAHTRARALAPPSAEERFEALAAHGPGVELVDVISGRRWTT